MCFCICIYEKQQNWTFGHLIAKLICHKMLSKCSSKCLCVCVHLCECVLYWTHSTGVSEVLVCHVRAGGADLPGVSKQLGGGLHDALSCRKVILCVSIKVSTQPSDPTPQVGRNTYIYTHTWRHHVEWKIHYHWFVTSPQLHPQICNA